MSEDRKRERGIGWLIVLIGLAIAALLTLLYSARKRETSYEELLERRDELLRELQRLSALKAEGRLEQSEYERRRRAIVRNVESIERKLEEAERKRSFFE